MTTYAEKTQDRQHNGAANHVSPKQLVAGQALPFQDNRPETIAQRKLQEAIRSNNNTAQNRAVLQRQITVDHIDYNPVTNEYRDGYIDEASFYAAIKKNIKQLGGDYFNHWDNVRGELETDYNAADIDALTTVISQAIRSKYGGKRPVIAGQNINRLTEIVRDALAANIQRDYQMDMEQAEADDIALLKRGAALLSRAKGTPNSIPFNQMPNAIQGQVAERLNEIRAERARWNLAALTPNMWFPGAFVSTITARQKNLHYQGNHTNLAGWLPAVAAPTDHVSAAVTAIYDAAGQDLKDYLDKKRPSEDKIPAIKAEFQQLYGPQVATLSDAVVLQSSMAALCGGVSAYIEFSMSGGISRLMYDPVNQRIFITAHYKWTEGYSPFFEVTGFPAL